MTAASDKSWLSRFQLAPILSSFNYGSDRTIQSTKNVGVEVRVLDNKFIEVLQGSEPASETQDFPPRSEYQQDANSTSIDTIDVQRHNVEIVKRQKQSDAHLQRQTRDQTSPTRQDQKAQTRRQGLRELHSQENPKAVLGDVFSFFSLDRAHGTSTGHRATLGSRQRALSPRGKRKASDKQYHSKYTNTDSRAEVSDLPRSPRETPPVPWYTQWKSIVEKYRHVPADHTGAGLYKNETIPDKDGAIQVNRNYLANVMPLAATCQIYFSEAVRLVDPLPQERIAFLKYHSIKLINQRLRSPQALALETVTIVTHFVAISWVTGDSQGLQLHLKGLLTLIRLMGGWQALTVAKPLVVWVLSFTITQHRFDPDFAPFMDIMETMGDGESIRFEGTLSVEQNFVLNSCKHSAGRYGPHPLRSAVQPTHSNLRPEQLRHHLMVSISGPLHPLLFCLTALDDVCVELAQFKTTPGKAAAAFWQIQDYLVRKGDSRAYYQLPSPPFSPQDGYTHDAIIETVRIVALVLVAQALHRLTSTTKTGSAVHQKASMLWSVQYLPVTVREQWMTLAWALFLIIPFKTVDGERATALRALKHFCMQLHLSSWEQTQGFLQRYFYSPWLLEQPCRLLWLEMIEFH